MLLKRVSSVGAAAAALVLFGAGAAVADPSTSVSVKTTDSGITGGTGIFWGDYNGVDQDNPEALGACDYQEDGLRVNAQVEWSDSYGNTQKEVIEDADGANNGCQVKMLPNIPDGTKVYIEVCLKDGANGVHRYIGMGTAIA
ncbi:hypothetical protein ACIHCV_07725 [Streptomyces sp. NPDC051956]|uniref:hypothetical protein n=1 Tax=Streptomyces sp. NPDC051956 TaxID=3365677 RepID=UPI0037D8D191